MDLIQSEQDNVPVEAEPRYIHETASLPVAKTEHGHTWLRILSLILAGLVLVVIIVFFARWAYHKTHAKASPAKPATSQPAPAKVSQNAQPGSAPAKTPTSAGSSSSTPAPQSSTPQPAANPNSQITNTGPGDVVAIFISTSLAAAGLHYIVGIRRFNRTGV